MTNYKLDKNYKGYIKLSLEDLIIDERIAEMMEQNKKTFPTYLNKNLYDRGTVLLTSNRLERILEGYKTGLPPIEVKPTLGGRYDVLNGRHRVCATIMNGDKYIYAFIITDMADLTDDDDEYDDYDDDIPDDNIPV
jgi:hypothetical protein